MRAIDASPTLEMCAEHRSTRINPGTEGIDIRNDLGRGGMVAQVRSVYCSASKQNEKEIFRLRKVLLISLRNAWAGETSISCLLRTANEVELAAFLLDRGWPNAPTDRRLLRALECIQLVAADLTMPADHKAYVSQLGNIISLLEKSPEEARYHGSDLLSC